jgi:4,5-dihydroxyphthalate decarboxylase
MGRIAISLACGDYDRTRPLADGRVGVEGVDLTVVRAPVEDVFFRMLRNREFDVAELSLSSYVMTLDLPDRPFVALPVFPSRAFRHGAVYVRSDGDVSEPADLAGRQVGVPEFQMTAAVWVRGILADRHGLAIAAPRYRTGGLEATGRREKLALSLPPELSVVPIGSDQTLTQLLLDGELDALVTPRLPRPFADGDPRIRRLFAEPGAEERRYLAETGVFPIMHTVVVRRDVLERHPWLAQSLMQAFAAAQRDAYARLPETVALDVMLPWLADHVAEARRLLGDDYWAYGIEPNRHVLDAFLRYHHEQGLSSRRWALEDLFAPQTFEAAVV